MSRFPSPVKQLRHILELLPHRAMYPPEIERRVQKVFQEIGYRRQGYILNFSGLYRAASKSLEAGGLDWFNNKQTGQFDISRLYCPPPKLTPIGRCNWANEPVFYASTDNGVPVFEVRAGLNHTVIVSTWTNRANAPGEMATTIDIPSLVVGVERVVETLRGDHPIRNLLLENDDIFNKDTPSAIKEVDSFVGDLFTKSANDIDNLYWFTSAIARVILKHLHHPETNRPMDGFVYPSVESQFSGVNVVLNESFARTHLQVLGANWYEVDEYDAVRSYYKMRLCGGLGNDKVDHRTIWRRLHPKHGAQYYELWPAAPTPPYAAGAFSFEGDD